jgi:peptidyl-prolyl cis-trans isomerase A (cyclophilin A)
MKRQSDIDMSCRHAFEERSASFIRRRQCGDILVMVLLVLILAAAGGAAAKGPAGPTAIIHTTVGDLSCRLFPDKAPKTVANFIGLATGKKDCTNPSNGNVEHNRPLYDGVVFHRVIPEFMIQGGDPLGTGTGGPGYKFEDELRPDLLFDRPGRLAMADSEPNTNGSQFFITEKAQPGLDPCFEHGGCRRGVRLVPKGAGYTIFGQCDENSVELVKRIARMPRDPSAGDRPLDPVKIRRIEILGAGRP